MAGHWRTAGPEQAKNILYTSPHANTIGFQDDDTRNGLFPIPGFLREMFQFDDNELDFGLFKVLRLKRTFIEQFISGEGEQDLKRMVQRELA